MTGEIPDLPDSPELGPISGNWTSNSNAENIGLRAECNNEEIIRGFMDLSLTDTELSGEVQSIASASSMTIRHGDQIKVQSSSSMYESSRQDTKFNEDFFKTKICSYWSKSGECIYGKSCRFAHGTTELRER